MVFKLHVDSSRHWESQIVCSRIYQVFITSNLWQTSDNLALSSGCLRHSIAMAANSMVYLLSSPLTGHVSYRTMITTNKPKTIIKPIVRNPATGINVLGPTVWKAHHGQRWTVGFGWQSLLTEMLPWYISIKRRLLKSCLTFCPKIVTFLSYSKRSKLCLFNNTFKSLKTLITCRAFSSSLSGFDNTPSFFKTWHKGTFLLHGLFSIAFLCVRSSNNTENRKVYWDINI